LGERNRPIHISADDERVEQGAVDVLNNMFPVMLDDAVELKCLPGDDLGHSIPVLVQDLIHQEPLLGVTNPSRHSDTNYERIGRFDILGLTVISNITVFLLIDPVELCELDITRGECTSGIVDRTERWSPENAGRRL